MLPASPDDDRRSASFRKLRHDVMNPINVLLGSVSALLESDLTDVQRAWVRMARTSVERLTTVINEFTARDESDSLAGDARLADLRSIAVASIGKPFNREDLLAAIDSSASADARRLLLVDDSPELVTLVRSYLNGSRWHIDVAGSGEDAVAQASAARYDLVLMDIDLPGFDGATAAHAIRAAELAHGASPTPIIALTAYARPRANISTESARGVEPKSPVVVHIDDPDIAPLVPQFLATRRADVARYREALERQEYSQIQSHAHKMKGTGRGYGFSTISRIGEELELAAHRQDAAGVIRLIDELDDYLSRVSVMR